ncbi:MAG: hypothetical protein R2713_03135 [Ilumatobacteraceae bacterium]
MTEADIAAERAMLAVLERNRSTMGSSARARQPSQRQQPTLDR